MSFASTSLGWRGLLALAVSLVCAVLAFRRAARLTRMLPPDADALLSELETEHPLGLGERANEARRRAQIAELNQRIADISFELSLVPTTYATLTRVCLASGTALTLLGFLDWARSPLQGGARALVCALSGLVGAGVVSTIGRGAKRRVLVIREAWDRSSRELGKSLGTTLS